MMPQHYTKNTTEVSIWCNACRKMTMWRVMLGKRAFCIPCHEIRPAKLQEPPPAEDRQMDLFENQESERP
jgi:hypothetical protein